MKTRISALFGIAIIILHLCGCQNESVPENATDSGVDSTYYAQWPDADTALTSATDTTTFGESMLSICSNQKILKTDFQGTLLEEWPIPLSSNQSLQCICSDRSNNAYVLRITSDEETVRITELLTLDSNGKLLSTTTLPLTGLPLALLSDGNDGYFIACENEGNTTVYHLNAELNADKELFVPNFSQLLLCGEEYLVVQTEQSSLLTETGTEIEANSTTVSKLEEMTSTNGKTLDGIYSIFVTGDGHICMVDNIGMYELNLTSGTTTQFLTWESLGLEGEIQDPMVAPTLEQMLFLSHTFDSAAVLCVTTIAPEPDDHTITLTLGYWALTPADQMAIQAFNRSQNDYQIETICYYPESGDVTAAMTQMNADLLTGDAPDLYALNGMDVDALENAGLLLDLAPQMDADTTFDRSAYYENIWNLFKIDDGLYEFIPSFSLAGISGTQDILGARTGWTIEEFSAFADEHSGESLVAHSSNADFLYSCIRYGGQNMLDASAHTCSFDSGEMEAILQMCNRLPATPQEDGLLREDWITSIFAYRQILDEVGANMTFVGYPSFSASGPSVNAFYTYGVSASTQCKEGAWAFLKFLLRDNQQQIYMTYGFPIKKSIMEDIFSKSALPTSDKNSLFYDSEFQPLTEAEVEYLRSLIESASQRYFRYQQVLTIVDEEAKAYFSGDKSANEVCKIIQNRAMIYLGELR